MYILFILFFISLFGIVFMIGKKLTFLKKEQLLNNLNNIQEEVLFEIPHLGKIKHHTFENIKKYGDLIIVLVLRLYIRFSSFLKNKYEAGKTKIKNKSRMSNGAEKTQTSKFLKMISQYKLKVRQIKQKIYEEEKDL